MGKKRYEKPKVKFQRILDAMTEYGIPPDAQETIVIEAWAWVKQSAGWSETVRMIYGDEAEEILEERSKQ